MAQKKPMFSGLVKILRGVSSGWIITGDVFTFKNGHIIDIKGQYELTSDIMAYKYPTLEYFIKHCHIEAQDITGLQLQEQYMERFKYK